MLTNPLWKFASFGLAGVLLVGAIGSAWKMGDLRREREDAEKATAVVTADRDEIVTWAERACALVIRPFKAEKREDWGKACFVEIARIAAFEKDVDRATADAVTQHLNDQTQRANDAAVAANRSAATARRALQNMEKVNDAVVEDRVDGLWFGSFNDTAGLQPPGQTEARDPAAGPRSGGEAGEATSGEPTDVRPAP